MNGKNIIYIYNSRNLIYLLDDVIRDVLKRSTIVEI